MNDITQSHTLIPKQKLLDALYEAGLTDEQRIEVCGKIGVKLVVTYYDNPVIVELKI